MSTLSEDFRQLLDHLGITESTNEQGRLIYSISVTKANQTQERRTAHFDPVSQCWVLAEPSLPLNHPNAFTNVLQPSADLILSPILQNDGWWKNILPETPHTKFLVDTDWSSTSLGPIAAWPPSLRYYTSMCLSESRASFLVWEKQRVVIYNEGAVMLLGKRHPSLMGGSMLERWPEVVEEFYAYFDELEASGKGKMLEKWTIPLERYGTVEETWWDADLLPLREERGSIGGFCLTWFEITKQVVSERFNRIIDDIGNTFAGSDSNVWQHLHAVLGRYTDDIAMGILYSAKTADDGAHVLDLEATIGVRTTYQAAPSLLHLETDKTDLAPFLRAALEAGDQFLVLDTWGDDFPKQVLDEIDWQGYGEPSRYISVIPVLVFNNLLKGFVIIGLNPRLTLDGYHQQFLTDLTRQLGALLTTVTNAEQAKRREEKLLEDLAGSEKRIRKMAELAPMGMYDLSSEGKLLWANTHFFDILGDTSGQKNFKTFSWLDYIHPDDHEAAKIKMAASIIEKVHISDSLRLRKTWNPPDISGEQKEKVSEEPVWILYQAYPHIKDGTVESIMGCLTDISQFKWAESVQARSADAARAAKQRLEDFIDITSHEMRNPLSAVTQCADDILGSVDDAQNQLNNRAALVQELSQIADTAKSIALCASHQKRIIDDVLTLSKLDSALLSVVPVASKPDGIISDAMKMFAAEFASNGIQVDIVDESPHAFGLQDIAYYDATRLMQVLVNLITNAIKFTRAEDTREVVIKFGVSQQPPAKEYFGRHFAWSTTGRKRRDVTASVGYGDDQPIYLHFSVRDTGQGLPRDEAVHIFDKFIQANRRTYIKYGGSGLGLFISRELIELQGGKIGVGSEIGVGSTFAFYVKARRGVAVPSPGDIKAQGPSLPYQKRAARDVDAAVQFSTSQTNPSNDVGAVESNRKGAMAASQDATTPLVGTKRRSSGFKTYNILLVEDNVVNQKVLAKQLRKIGFTVTIANHGGEAVDRLLQDAGQELEYQTEWTLPDSESLPFDCILMDWEMPVLDGLSATRRIRELEKAGKIKDKQIIIGVTANARIEQIQQAEAAGMDEIVVKPFRVPDLVDRIALATGFQ